MKKSSGFTFIETLIATAVLVIAVGGALEVYNRTLENITFDRKQYIYLMEVQRIMDEILYQAEQNFGNVLTNYDKRIFASTYAKRINLPSFFEIPVAYAFVGAPPPPPPPPGPQSVPGEPAPATGTTNMGVVYVTNLHPGTTATTTYLLRAKVVMCWNNKGRIIGEDRNLNGVLDAGEDVNANGEIDSPTQLETVMVRKD